MKDRFSFASRVTTDAELVGDQTNDPPASSFHAM